MIAALAVAVFALSLLFPPARRVGESERATVMIPSGATPEEIAAILKDKGIIRNRAVFVLAARAMGMERKLRAGRFTIEKRLGTLDVIRQLTEAMKPEDLVTIPEGQSSRGIAQILRREVFIDPEEFLSLVDDSLFALSLGVEAGSLEGYLFPDSYAFAPQMEPATVIKEMVSRGRHLFGVDFSQRAAEVGLTWHEVLTFASIVEAEAQVEHERPRIAAVFWNRLARGWRLQADPTVAYALGGKKQRIVYRDLDVKSPYNTYLVRDLPPGPINNPGKAAVRAVLFPLKNCKDMYFVARGDGTHIFSRTMEEHVAARERVKALRRSGASSSRDGGGVPKREELGRSKKAGDEAEE
ncbi:MAG: endolytic transglycosylase MltG [Candidatus Eiseniibacteriota bacterium]|nr:MAG: endolytic transglycosylase MltG [Candidatus Eisenbacteria bacterium]